MDGSTTISNQTLVAIVTVLLVQMVAMGGVVAKMIRDARKNGTGGISKETRARFHFNENCIQAHELAVFIMWVKLNEKGYLLGERPRLPERPRE